MRTRPVRAALAAIVPALLAGCAAARPAVAQSTTVHAPPTSDDKARGPFSTDAPDMTRAASLAGCYDITLGAWSEPRAHGGNMPMPARIDLRTERHARVYVGFGLVARTPGFVRSERHPPAWSPVGADSLQVRAWADGMSSVTLFLRRQPADTSRTLRGTARYFTDGIVVDSTGRWMWETYPAAPATLRPVACEATGG